MKLQITNPKGETKVLNCEIGTHIRVPFSHPFTSELTHFDIELLEGELTAEDLDYWKNNGEAPTRTGITTPK